MSVRRDQDGRSGQPTDADTALVSTRRGGGRVVAPKQIKVGACKSEPGAACWSMV